MHKVIKTEAEHLQAMKRIDELLALSPASDSLEDQELELLILLVQNYESETVSIGLPEPIAAIKFRMEQQGLKQRDLIPYLGSKSRVSEVLSGKRPLSLSMIRALEANLGISASVLIQESMSDEHTAEIDAADDYWSRFPVREMQKRGWLSSNFTSLDEKVAAIKALLFPLNDGRVQVLNRRSLHPRFEKEVDQYSLLAWAARVAGLAHKDGLPTYTPGTINKKFMVGVAQLSVYEDGPLRAVHYLREAGIVVVIVPHLSHTYLDGAAMLLNGVPVIGLSLRYDRLDNFWFCLLHELAHIAQHLDAPDAQPLTLFFDDLDSSSERDAIEREADDLARSALIPVEIWQRSPAREVPSQMAAEILARAAGVHNAIAAGRIRFELGEFKSKHLGNMVGQREVRKWFPGIEWS